MAEKDNSGLILIVEDDLSIRGLLPQILAKAGYNSKTVASGEEALKHLCSGRYIMMISDIKLGGEINGVKLRQIRDLKCPKTPFLLISGDSDGTYERSLLVGRNVHNNTDYLPKPFKMEDLVEKVNYLLKKEDRTCSVS